MFEIGFIFLMQPHDEILQVVESLRVVGDIIFRGSGMDDGLVFCVI
mgnify:CR=1 FL=1